MALWMLAACFGEAVDSADPRRDPDRDDPRNPDDSGEGDDTGLEAEPLPTPQELLADLRVEGDAALLEIANTHGWPVETSEGLLFVYEASGAWLVAGDFDGWAGQAMRCEDGLCWLVVDASSGGYKFTNGADWRADPWSRRFTYDEFGELSLVNADDAHIERFFAVGDAQNEPRTVRILVPEGPVTHVLYAEDGQNLFDPDAMWGGWRLKDSAPAGLLIVGIDNTPARFDEYTHVPDHIDDSGAWYGGKGDAYADFVQDTVRPLIRSEYGEPGPVGLLGSSLGGLISLHIADRYPGEFAFAASMSGTLGWGSIGAENDTIIQRYAAAGHRGTALYLDSGGSGSTCADRDGDGTNDDDLTASDNYCETVQLRDVLSDAGYTFDTDLWHWWEADAEHNEAYWAARVYRPLDIFVSL